MVVRIHPHSPRIKTKVVMLEKRISEELINATKEKDNLRMAALRAIKNGIIMSRHLPAMGGEKEMGDDDVVKIIQKLAKEREESAAIYKENGRDDLYNGEMAELRVLKEFLPEMLSYEEHEQAVDAIIEETGASSMKDMGKIMAALNSRGYGSRVDRGTISKIVKKRFGG